jgi:hypothetical protein
LTHLLERLAPYVGLAIGLSETAVLEAYRPARESEIPAILSLRRQVNTDVWWDDQAFVAWRYFSRRTETGDPLIWVLGKGGECLGACGIEPVTLVLDGRAVPAVRTLDIMVRPDLDGLGLGAFMNLVLFRHFPILMVTGSNARSHTLLHRMFQHTTDLRFWKTAIHSGAMIQAKLGLGFLTPLIASAVDPLLSMRRARYRVPTEGLDVRDLPAFDSSVDELSRQCEVSGRVLVRRTDALLNWRFARNPRCRYRLHGAFRGDRMVGYLVTRFNRARPNPRRDGEIVDWLAAPGDEGAETVLPALIQAGVDALALDGAEMVSCAGVSEDLSAAMSSTGFRFRPGERLPFFVKASDPALHERLSTGGGWYLTRGDHDVE